MPHTVDSPGAARAIAWKLFLGVLVLNTLLAFTVLYQTYKHYSPEQAPMDTSIYLTMAQEGPTAVGDPFRYRVLTPLLVRAMNGLPGYAIAVDFTTDPAVQKTFFHFVLVNFAFTVLASVLLFLWLRTHVPDLFAWAGSLLYLFSFHVLTANNLPMTDAACHLAIIAAILFFEKRMAWAFAVTCFIGVFAKETLLVVLVLWIAVHAVGEWKRLRWLALLLPALAAYLALTRLMPMESVAQTYYDPAFVLAGILRVFDPALYTRSFLFHAVLAQLPLLVAFLAWGWLRWGRGVTVPAGRGLWVFFALLLLGIAMDIGNNAGRVAFMAFPAVALFQARVMAGVGGGMRQER